MALKENYKDDILDVSVNTKRKYRMTENQDGTVSFDDETEYLQEGDNFGSGAINPIAHAINGLNNYTFNPSGSIDLVAYIADDSYYLNEDNKYVLADSPTGQALITSEPSTYKALASDTDLYGIEGEDTVSGFEPSCTPITVEGQTLSTIDDKLNFIIEGLKPPIEQVYGRRASGRDAFVAVMTNHNNIQNVFYGAGNSNIPSDNTLETMDIQQIDTSTIIIKAKKAGRFKYALNVSSNIGASGKFAYTENNYNIGDAIISSSGSNFAVFSVMYLGDAT